MSRHNHCTEEFQQIERGFDTLGWHRARIRFLARFLVALISVKSVCLSQIASVFATQARPQSSYKRIQRFLSDFDLDYSAVAALVAALVAAPPPWVLSLDRTDWKLGRVHINLLVLALVYKGVAFPLLWTSLGKAGATDAAERIALLERFVCIFGRGRVAFVCADREFACCKLVDWLLDQGLSFRLRIKGDTHVENARGQGIAAWRLFQNCAPQTERALPGRRRCLGRRVFVAGTRWAGDYLIVISDTQASLGEYALRWGIETMFGCFKSRGFCLEATHVTAPDRLERLLALLSLAFVWAFWAGRWQAQHKPIKIKKHGRAAVSLFRLGFDFLRKVLMPLCGNRSQADFQIALGLLSCT